MLVGEHESFLPLTASHRRRRLHQRIVPSSFSPTNGHPMSKKAKKTERKKRNAKSAFGRKNISVT